MNAHGNALDSKDTDVLSKVEDSGTVCSARFCVRIPADSDIDFMADFDEDAEWDLFDHMDMEEELCRIVGREVDLLTLYSVESSGNRFYKEKILTTAEPIFAR